MAIGDLYVRFTVPEGTVVIGHSQSGQAATTKAGAASTGSAGAATTSKPGKAV